MGSDGEGFAVFGALVALCCIGVIVVIGSPLLAAIDLGLCKATDNKWLGECKAGMLAPHLKPGEYLTSLVRVLTIPVSILLLIAAIIGLIIGVLLMGLGGIGFIIVAVICAAIIVFAVCCVALLILVIIMSPCFISYGIMKCLEANKNEFTELK